MRKLFLLGMAVGWLAACGRQPAASDTPKAAPTAAQSAAAAEGEIVIPVQAALARRGPISSHFETTSRIEAEKSVQVTPESVGECRKIYVEEGDQVKADDVLAELDQTELLATIGQTEVQIRQTKTAYDIAERSLSEGIGSKAERDNAKFAYEQAQATLDMQKVRLEKLTIRAPLSGVVTKRNVQVGQFVAGGMPVFNIVDPLSYMLTIFVPERELPRLKVGQVAKVTVDALGDQEFRATVRRVNPGVDSSTGTVKVVLDFDAATREKLREAGFARVRLVMETHDNALLVAKDAVVEENARKYVFVVQEAAQNAVPVAAKSEPTAPQAVEAAVVTPEGGAPAHADAEPNQVAQRIEVETGLEDSSYTEVLSGVQDDSLVVTMGQHTLKAGTKVKVTNAGDEMLSKASVTAEDALKTAEAKRAKDEGKPKVRPVQQHGHMH